VPRRECLRGGSSASPRRSSSPQTAPTRRPRKGRTAGARPGARRAAGRRRRSREDRDGDPSGGGLHRLGHGPSFQRTKKARLIRRARWNRWPLLRLASRGPHSRPPAARSFESSSAFGRRGPESSGRKPRENLRRCQARRAALSAPSLPPEAFLPNTLTLGAAARERAARQRGPMLRT